MFPLKTGHKQKETQGQNTTNASLLRKRSSETIYQQRLTKLSEVFDMSVFGCTKVDYIIDGEI
jgi:hypothetical protein